MDGILLLDKPSGPSSNQALQRVKRALRARKAGHVGTLDPLASGLLPIVLGEATKFASHLSDADKAYDASVLLGVTTSTGDTEGEVIERRSVAGAIGRLNDVVAQFRGVISQTPPMFSAIKIAGRPLYELARQGKHVARQAREVRIDTLDIRVVSDDQFDMCVRCSKGTYIRVLAEDIGRLLGCGATLKRLRRVAVGNFVVGDAVGLVDIESGQGELASRALLPIDAGLSHVPVFTLDALRSCRVRMGQRVDVPEATVSGQVRLYASQPRVFLGLGIIENAVLAPLRLIVGDQGRHQPQDTDDYRDTK